MILTLLAAATILNACEPSSRVPAGIPVAEVGETLGGLFAHWNPVYSVGRKSVTVRPTLHCENIHASPGDSERGVGIGGATAGKCPFNEF